MEPALVTAYEREGFGGACAAGSFADSSAAWKAAQSWKRSAGSTASALRMQPASTGGSSPTTRSGGSKVPSTMRLIQWPHPAPGAWR